MSIWKEKYNRKHHCNMMNSNDTSYDESRSQHDNIQTQWVYFVEACGFTFQFLNLAQLEKCLAYYEQKVHGSTRESIGAADHWEVQRWYERLPLYLRKESKRSKAVRALSKARERIIIDRVSERNTF